MLFCLHNDVQKNHDATQISSHKESIILINVIKNDKTHSSKICIKVFSSCSILRWYIYIFVYSALPLLPLILLFTFFLLNFQYISAAYVPTFLPFLS